MAAAALTGRADSLRCAPASISCVRLWRRSRGLASGLRGSPGWRRGGGYNALVYLMRVGWAFASHRPLWQSGGAGAGWRAAKSASENPLGDVYEPVSSSGDPLDPIGYRPPTPRHVHAAEDYWLKDISYIGPGDSAALLVGDPVHSYLWRQPSSDLTIVWGEATEDAAWLLCSGTWRKRESRFAAGGH